MLKKLTHKQRIFALGGLAALVVVAGTALVITARSQNKAASTTVNPSGSTASSPNDTSTAKGSSGSSAPAATSSQLAKQSSPTTAAASSTLTAPQGQANHTIVSKSAGEQAENSPNMEVTCLTSSGNNCVVRLTSPKGQVSIINNTHNDKQGNFIFDWSAKSYETGSWKMELVASRDGQEAAVSIGPLQVTP